MNSQVRYLHIAIAFDQNYLQPFYALLSSLLLNRAGTAYHIHLIASGVEQKEREGIRSCIEQNQGAASFYTIDESLVRGFVLLSNWTSTVYYRLFFPFLVPKTIDRLLYLDADTIVLKDLTSLFESDIENFPLGAVYDNYVKIQARLNITEEGEYFNSGVLLFDLKKWREQKISEQAFDYLTRHPQNILFVDQCALNAVLFKNWKKLPLKYNVLYSYVPESMSKSEFKKFLADKVIIHYTLHRPWNMLSKNRLGYLYHYYLRKSPLYKGFISYTDFSIGKILPFLKLKFINAYLDSPFLVKVVQRMKKDIAN